MLRNDKNTSLLQIAVCKKFFIREIFKEDEWCFLYSNCTHSAALKKFIFNIINTICGINVITKVFICLVCFLGVPGLKNPHVIRKLQCVVLQALQQQLARNHVEHEQVMQRLVGMIPLIRFINHKHMNLLNRMKMTNSDMVKMFPPLHAEIYNYHS